MTVQDFQNSNTIIAQYKIVESTHGNAHDVIDVNGNGVEDYNWQPTASEPSLDIDYRKIKDFAANQKTSIVTKSDLGNIKAYYNTELTTSHNSGSTCSSPRDGTTQSVLAWDTSYQKSKETTLDDLTRTSLNPFPDHFKNPEWAITDNRELLIFEPKARLGWSPSGWLEVSPQDYHESSGLLNWLDAAWD